MNFGRPLAQSDYSLDPPPDREVRPKLDYRFLRPATVGDRDLFYVWDGANARIIAFQRADGAFVRQWMAPRTGPNADLLRDVIGLQVLSVADGPPAAYLLSQGRVVRVVLGLGPGPVDLRDPVAGQQLGAGTWVQPAAVGVGGEVVLDYRAGEDYRMFAF